MNHNERLAAALQKRLITATLTTLQWQHSP